MKTFTFITSNKEKIETAQRHLSLLNIRFSTNSFDMPEIQSESVEEVALQKAKLAYKQFKSPVVISDHGWNIPALNGFPGPYMKYIKKWLKIKDFVNLMNGHEDKSIIKQEVICYCDENGPQTFICIMPGKFVYLSEVNLGEITDLMEIVSLRESGKTVTECNLENIDQSENYDLWEQFGHWFLKQQN